MWFLSALTAIHNLGVVSTDVCCHTQSQERNLVLCCWMLLLASCLCYCIELYFEVMGRTNAEAHTLQYTTQYDQPHHVPT